MAGEIVLVTRPEAEAADTARRLRAMGWAPLIAPMLRIEPVMLRIPAGRRPQAVLVTSGNALAALPEGLRATRLLAVGDATAARARACGFTRAESAAGDADDLLRLVVARCDPAEGPLLLAAGAGHALPLLARLQAAGFRVAHRVAYRTTETARLDAAAAAAIRAGSAAAALFFSGATALAFRRAIARAGLERHLAGVTAIAISPRAAQALAPLPWGSIRVASHPSQDELLACL
jgi:uroporphyrinogen-III synthase